MILEKNAIITFCKVCPMHPLTPVLTLINGRPILGNFCDFFQLICYFTYLLIDVFSVVDPSLQFKKKDCNKSHNAESHNLRPRRSYFRRKNSLSFVTIKQK